MFVSKYYRNTDFHVEIIPSYLDYAWIHKFEWEKKKKQHFFFVGGGGKAGGE